MKAYRIYFETINHEGNIVTHYGLVLMRKIPGRSAYSMRWDVTNTLDDRKVKPFVVEAEDERGAIEALLVRNFGAWTDLKDMRLQTWQIRL